MKLHRKETCIDNNERCMHTTTNYFVVIIYPCNSFHLLIVNDRIDSIKVELVRGIW